MKVKYFCCLVLLFSPVLHATSLLQAVNAARRYDAEFSAAFQAKRQGMKRLIRGWLACCQQSVLMEVTLNRTSPMPAIQRRLSATIMVSI